VKSAEGALASALPTGEVRTDTDFRLAVFGLARHLKAVPELRDQEASKLKPWVREWYEQAAGHLGNRTFTDTYAEFVPAWKAVIHAADDDPVKLAWDIAREQPLPRVAEEYGDPRIGRLIVLCRNLQHENELHGRRTGFSLSGYQAEKLLGVSQTTAAKWLGVLVEDGILEVTDKGGGFRGGRRMAREYRLASPGGAVEDLDLEPRDEPGGTWDGEPDVRF
jgi:hypothetical protein